MLACVFVPWASYAARPTEVYAPEQLRLATRSLNDAQAAAAAADYARAGRLAWGAELDARLTWAMTDEASLRAQAAAIAAQAIDLEHSLAAHKPGG